MYTVGAMRAALSSRVKVATDVALVQGYQEQAIQQMIDSCWWRIQDRTFIDLVVDGQTARWFIPGEDISILPLAYQAPPSSLNTARIAPPTIAPTVSATGSGSGLAAGVYRCVYAWQTSYGETQVSPVATVTLQAGQNILFAAPAQPPGTLPITAVVRYVSDANDVNWKSAGSTPDGSGTVAAAGITAAPAGKPFLTYVPFSGVAWNLESPDNVLLEELIKVDGTMVVPGTDTIGATVSASAPPAVAGAGNVVRVHYLRRVPAPDLTQSTSAIRVREDFARAATLGYYLAALADNQPGGDARSWRTQSNTFLTQAQTIYNSAVPEVLPQSMRGDEWLAS